MTILRLVLIALLVVAPPLRAQDQLPPDTTAITGATAGSVQERRVNESEPPDRYTQLAQLRHAVERLPVAAGLAAALALRPRRKGTPRRQATVIQTQIILAVIGAVVMLVVGTSLARAFGIVGAAGLVRYRAKIDDPKDAGVMLATLAVGLAAGVGLWMLGLFSTVFIVAVLWVIESFEPKAKQLFHLTVKAKDPAAAKPKVDGLFERHHLESSLRTAGNDELAYEVKLPLEKKPDRLTAVLLKLDPENITSVEWEEKKDKSK
jgi:hypothetical protein